MNPLDTSYCRLNVQFSTSCCLQFQIARVLSFALSFFVSSASTLTDEYGERWAQHGALFHAYNETIHRTTAFKRGRCLKNCIYRRWKTVYVHNKKKRSRSTGPTPKWWMLEQSVYLNWLLVISVVGAVACSPTSGCYLFADDAVIYDTLIAIISF